MSFSSPRFFAFLAVLLLVLAGPWRLERKKAILALASCLFYAAWNWRCLGLLLFVSVVDYYCAARISPLRVAARAAARRWLLVSLVSNLGLLAFFKYTNFFIDNANSLFGTAAPHLNVLLPAGISFYTFKTMSYTIDVYRGEIEPVSSWMNYVTFVTFFPELIAGPIVRASVFLPQMSRPIGPTRDRLSSGASIFLLGLTKKVLLADRLATIADPIFADPAAFRAPVLWAGALAYTLQIYCDFSGYSDLAIGTAKMIGYDLPENFNMPYLARNVAEFWHRWHITLSTWLRDYLYIPLGGNRRGRGRTYVNLFTTMLLGGLWHGASWNFVLWGGLHGSALALHRWLQERGSARLPASVARAGTFLFVLLAWVPFRCPSFTATALMLGKMLTWSNEGMLWEPWYLYPAILLLVIGHAVGVLAASAQSNARWSEPLRRLLCRFGARIESGTISGWYLKLHLYPTGAAFMVCVWLLLIGLFASGNAKPFIYFQF